MFDRRTGVALLLLVGPAHLPAQDARAEPLDLETTQAKADAAFEAGRYDEAYEIYLDDLVPTGDKYAQYMVGVMHLHGLGRPKDLPLGAAWMALAAERGEAKLEAERDAIVAKLSDGERRAQQSLLQELQTRFSDCALVAQALAESREGLDASTGSRLASGVSQPVTVLFDQAEEDDRLSQRDLRRLMRKRERFLRDSCPRQGA